jgi:hypothetical protein
VLAMTFIVGGTLWNALQSMRAYFREKKHVEGTDHEGITRQDNNI